MSIKPPEKPALRGKFSSLISGYPVKLDLDIYPYLPRANVATTSPASYLSLMTEGQS